MVDLCVDPSHPSYRYQPFHEVAQTPQAEPRLNERGQFDEYVVVSQQFFPGMQIHQRGCGGFMLVRVWVQKRQKRGSVDENGQLTSSARYLS